MDSNQKDKKLGFSGVCLFVQNKKKDVGGIMTGVSVRKVLTMFVQSSSIIIIFLT
uniref:Uncharacterized protein n=1 Tax=Picea glauca TaxID=3330 RepID=A0A124GP34_PICGL|nr:hypothetical protein ABT39_MTgene566 [Picea glauca]